MTPVVVPFRDRYTTVERGLAEGVGQSMAGSLDLHVYEVAPYLINHGVLLEAGSLLINLDKWNSIPPHLQELIIDVRNEVEKEVMIPLGKELYANSVDDWVEAGGSLISFSPSDAKWYTDVGLDSTWDKMMERWPEVTTDMGKMIRP